MKYGVAVVLGALGMFVSGYILGFTTAVPDVMRAASLNPDGNAFDETMSFDVTSSVPVLGADAVDPAAMAEADAEMEAMRLQEIQDLKKMIVPLLTDDEIKKIREEAAKPAPVEEAPAVADPIENPQPGEAAPSAP